MLFRSALTSDDGRAQAPTFTLKPRVAGGHVSVAGLFMAGIVVLTAFALVLDAAVGRIEGRLMKWQPRAGETEKL